MAKTCTSVRQSGSEPITRPMGVNTIVKSILMDLLVISRNSPMVKKKGQNKIATWKATSGIVNAVKAMLAHGDADKISAAMGGRHKEFRYYVVAR